MHVQWHTVHTHVLYIACAMLMTHLPRWGLLAPLAPSSSCLILLTSSSDSDCSLFLRSRACFCSSYSLRASVSERFWSRRFLSNLCLSSISNRRASCSESWSSFWRRSRIDCSSWRDDCLANRLSSCSWRLRLITLHKINNVMYDHFHHVLTCTCTCWDYILCAYKETCILATTKYYGV